MVIAVDFDGTIVEHKYPDIGKPLPFAFEVLKKFQQEEHHILILWTVREGKLLQDAVDFCRRKGLTFYAVNKNHPEEEPGDSSRKLAADIFIDDRNIGGIPDWGMIYQILKSGVESYNPYEIDEFPGMSRQRKKNLFTRLGELWDQARG